MSLHTDFKDYVIRSEQSFEFAREIQLPFGQLRSALDWCKAQLCDDWRWQMVDMSHGNGPGRYIFYFDSERDYLVFVLKWT